MPVRVESLPESVSDSAVRLRLMFFCPPPERFRSVRVFDLFGTMVLVDQPSDCVSHWEVTTPLLSREALPLTAEMSGCDGAPDTPRGFNPPIQPRLMRLPDPDPGPGASCLVLCDDNVACNNAIATGLASQAEMEIVCADWRRFRDRSDELERFGAVMIAVGLACFIAFIVFSALGWPWALLGLAFLAAAIALVYFGNAALEESRALRARQQQLLPQLAALRARIQAAIAAAGRNCCPGCGTVFPTIPC